MGKLGGKQIKVINLGDKEYPKQLIDIKNSPKQLYVEGNLELLNTNMISIVGSRHCSENGKKLAQKFTRELVEQGITIVSGMAAGIDMIAHKTTLECKGKTIAVLGNGFYHIFPKENEPLYYNIIESGGLIISEYPPEVKAKSQYFIERNRIVSGIAIGVLIIEATYRSGTSITARFATQQNKKVFVLPHEIDDIHGVGTNRLIRKGATLVTSTQEIIKEYEFLEYKKIQNKKIKNTKESFHTKNKDKNTSDKYKDDINIKLQKKKLKKGTDNEKYEQIYDLITTETININEIYKKTDMQLKEISQILFFLEIEGYIEKIAGGYRCILNKK